MFNLFSSLNYSIMHKRIFCSLLSLTLLVNVVYAQKISAEEKRLYKKAKKQLSNEQFKDAQSNYLKLIQLNPNNEKYNFEGGLSFYFSDHERTKSISLFETTLYNSKEDTIPEIYFYLGRAYHLNGDYAKSTIAFNKFKPFIQTQTSSGKALMKQSEYYINANKKGTEYFASKNENIKTINLGNVINTTYSEYAPVIKKDENILLFTSRRKGSSNKTDKDLLPFEDVFVAKNINESWQLLTDKKEIEKFVPNTLNSKKHDAGIIYSSDGNTLYTYKKDAIWKSILEKDKWSDLVKLDKNVNSSKFNIPSVTLSNDGNTIYFVSFRKDGIGDKDIYKSSKNSDGNWSKAENLGETINTPLDEDSPYLSEDGNTLYFSSKGHDGIGGYDIFKSDLVNGSWGTPVNMGIPINSPVDDIYLTIDGDNGFFASAREGGLGGMDIYSLCMNCPTNMKKTINGLLVDNNDSPINLGNVTLKELSTSDIIGTYETAKGKFNFTTESTGFHQLTVNAPNFEKQITKIELPKESSTSDLTLKLSQLTKDGETYQILTSTSSKLGINLSDTIKIENLIVNNDSSSNSSQIIATYQQFFNYNKKEINSSNSEFKQMINKAISKDGPIHIYIESSASNVPTKTFKTNIKLASLRGDESKKFIISALKEKGINEEQIVVKSINSIVSGPNYSGDFKNTKKYEKFQYVKVTIK